MTTTTRPRPAPPAAGVPAAPPLPDDVEALLRRLRMPHTRAAAPDVLATARSQCVAGGCAWPALARSCVGGGRFAPCAMSGAGGCQDGNARKFQRLFWRTGGV